MSYFDLYRDRVTASSIKETTKGQVESMFEDSLAYYKIQLNGQPTDALVTAAKLPDERTILLKPESVLNKGDIIGVLGATYLTIETFGTDLYPKGIIKYCNHTVTVNGNIKSCIVTNRLTVGQRYDEDAVVVMPSENQMMILSADSDTMLIKHSDEFMIYGRNWRIIAVDNVSSAGAGKGIIIFQLEAALSDTETLENDEQDWW